MLAASSPPAPRPCLTSWLLPLPPAGGGATQLVMPYLFAAINIAQPDFIAWRVAFFIPAWCQILIGLAVLAWGQDLPDGENTLPGLHQISKGVVYCSTLQYSSAKMQRAWLLALSDHAVASHCSAPGTHSPCSKLAGPCPPRADSVLIPC